MKILYKIGFNIYDEGDLNFYLDVIYLLKYYIQIIYSIFKEHFFLIEYFAKLC